MDQSTRALLEWFKDADIEVEENVSIRRSSLGGLGVFAERDFPEDEVIFKIPKNSVLSPNT